MWSGWRAVAWLVLWSSVLAVGTGLVRGFMGSPEQVSQLFLVAAIDDRELRITETIDYDFVTEERHGIHRDIPQLGRAEVRATSRTAAADLQREQDGATAKLRIGSPHETVSGLHRYELSYLLHRGFMANKLRWDAVGTTWKVPIRRVEIWVVSDMALSEPRCFVGGEGSETPCTIEQVGPGRLHAVVEDLGERRGITVEARASEEEVASAPAPAPPALPEPLDVSFRPALVHGLAVGGASFGVGLLVILFMAWRFRLPRIRLPPPTSPRGYRTPPPAALASEDTPGEAIDVRRAASTMPPLHEPPEGLAPSQGGMVWSKGLEDRQCVAWLLERIREGALAITGTEDDLVLERRGPAADPYHEETLETAFQDQTTIPLGGPSTRFVRLWRNVEFGLRAWSRREKLWADRDRAQAVGSLGSVFAFVALFVAMLTSATEELSALQPGLGALGGGLVGLVVAAELFAPYTVEGLQRWLAVARFRRFLEAEDDYGDWARDHDVVDRYTAWAVALGVQRTWLEDVAPVDRPSPSHQPLRDMAFDGRLERLALSSGVSADRSPGGGSSSSSSSSGGGSVGGGAGGGGGGSW